jgi:hypothetical protein
MHGSLLGGPEEEPGESRHRQVRGQDVPNWNMRLETRNQPLL